VAQARSDVFFSIGAQVAPGVNIGISNGGYYPPQPVYYPPQPVYVQPAPVYYAPQPVYYPQYPQVYVAPPVYGVSYIRPWGPGYRHHGGRHWR
jgi:hypothetical protein